MNDQNLLGNQEDPRSVVSRYSSSVVNRGRRMKLWVVGFIVFVVFAHLVFPLELIPIFQQWMLVVVLVLVGFLWVGEARERDRIQITNNELLEDHVRLEHAQVDMISSIVRLVESKAPYVHGHSSRVAQISALIAESFDFSADTIERIRRAAMLHDLGRIVMRDDILEKAGALTEQEWAVMRQHPEIAENILMPLRFLHLECRIIRHHHERIDGRGYPDGLAGKDIPLESRIIAAAETFDEMNTETFYRPALSIEKIKSELKEAGGSQLDAEIVKRLLLILENDPGLWRRPDAISASKA